MSRRHDENWDPFNVKGKAVHELSFLRKLVFYPAAWFLQLYFRTWRIRMDEASRKAFQQASPPRLVVVWHNRSLPMPEVFRRCFNPEKVVCLISPSKLAAWEVAFFHQFRLQVVRGSTTRRSVQAAREMLRGLRSGNDVGISPDGPSGPLYSFQLGAIAIARKAGVPMLLAIPNCRRARRLNTWDRHLVPWPFARIDFRARLIAADDPVWEGTNEEVAEHARRVCLEITDDPFHVDNHEQAGVG